LGPAKRLIAGALEDDHDAGPIERGCPQLEKKFGDFLPVTARDQRPAGANSVSQHGPIG
jgi:hypothetical protein